MSVRNTFTVLEETAAKLGDRPALHQPLPGSRKEETKYRTYSWNEYRDIAREIALGLRSLGIRPGDVVAIHSETRAEFYLADFGVIASGATSAAMYTSIALHELAHSLRTMEPKLVLVENPKTMKSLQNELGDLQLDAQWVLLTGECEGIMTLDQLRERGREMGRNPEVFASIQQEIRLEDPAILYMTSGATGAPKMGLVSHRAIVSNIDMGPAILDLGPDDRTIAFLPSAHIAQRVAVQMLTVRLGVQVYFSESLARLPLELRQVKPTMFLAPPRVWERMYSTIATEIRKRGPATRQLFYAAMGAGAKAYKMKQEGRPVTGYLARLVNLFDKPVYSKIRERLGGELKVAISGSAPLAKDLADFFGAIGLPIAEGYGLTEAGVTTLNPVERPKSGSIGKMLAGVQAKVAEDGELLIGGPTLFSGYFKDPDATRTVLRDGWLYTGDLGQVDSEGYWSITGRKKEIIVSSNGKKVYPARIEALFKSEPLVNQMMVIGDKLPYVSALFTVNPTHAEALPGMEGFKGKPLEVLSAAGPVFGEMQKAVGRVNKQLATFEQIRKWRILGREFSIESGEITPTMKVRRAKVLENHREMISEFYAGKDMD